MRSNFNSKAFDTYSATLGIPMEKRFTEPSDYGNDYSSVTSCLGELLKSEIIQPCYICEVG